MELNRIQKILMSSAGALLLIGFFVFTNSIKDTAMVWYETRLFGLISFFALFLTVLLGELRLLQTVKGEFELFRFHKPIAIFAVTSVFLHMASAMMDHFKWGKTLSLVQFLGFSFGDKWLIFLSFGTLAFYLMILISLTSMKKGMQIMGFKKWKILHFFSYISFIIAYLHSINLGTDLKSTSFQYFLLPIFLILFWTIISLLLARIASSVIVLEDKKEFTMLAAFFILLIFGLVFTTKFSLATDAKTTILEGKLADSQNAVQSYSNEVSKLRIETDFIQMEIEGMNDG